MDFFTMKRKKLQTLCKKNGIPANLKNIEMAEKLSLIYKEKENENPVSRRLRTVKDKLNVEIIVLDSDSDTEVQLEAPDIVAVTEKDSNEMNNVNVEHFLDEVEVHSSGLKHSVGEPDQILATSSPSKVKSSDLNFHRTVDSDIVAVAEKDSDEMNNVNVEHFLDEVPSSGLKNSGEPDQFLVTSPPSEVKSSDLNIRRMVDSDTAAEKDSNEKTNVDELQSSCLKYSVGEPDQFLVTSPLSEVKSSDLNIHHMVYSGTSGGNADVNEVKSASSQQLSRGQEESQMKLQGEKSEDNVRSVYLEEYKQMSFIKEKIEENQELYHATAADLNVHHMVDSGTASGHVDACEVISESLQTTSQGLEMSTMKLTPERNDNVRPFYVEENMQMSVNFLEQFGNYMMMREDSDRTPVQFLPTSDLNIHKVAVKDVCEVKSASSQQMKFPSERSDYNVGSFNLEENKQMSGDKAQIEDNRELYAATPSDPNVHLMVDSDIVAEKDSNGKTNVFPDVDEVPSSGLKYLVGEPDQVLTTTPLSEVKSSDHNIHHMGDSGTVAGNADACEVKSASLQQTSQAQEEPKMKLQCERSENIVGSFYLEENMQMSDNKEHIEDNQELSPATPTDLDVLHMVDPGTAAGHADGCEVNSASSQGREEAKMKPTPERSDDVGTFYVEENMYMSVNTVAEPEDENEPFTANTKRKRSDVVDTNSDEEVKAGELVHSVSQSSEMMSCNFSLQQLFASDTCEEEMLNLSEKEKTCMVADLEACIGFPPNDLEAATTKGSEDDKYFDPTILRNVVTETCRIDKVEKENNQEDCLSAQGEVSKFFDNSDVGADELVQAVPQPSEMESYNFSLQQLFASGTAGGNADVCGVKSASSQQMSQGTAAGHADSCEVKSASLQGREEAKMKLTPAGSDNVGTFYVKENMYMSVNTVEDPEDENEPYMTSTKRKRSDVVDTNSDEEVKAGELVHTVSQSSEMMSCNFSLQQLFASDTCEEEMLNLSEKEKTCMVADLEACIGFPPNDLEAATTKGSEDDKYFDPTILRNVVTETCRIDKVEKENNQEDCFSAQGEVSKLVDNSDVYDDISGVGAEAENQSHMTSRKRKSSDEDDTSANSDEDVKADELVPTVPQPSEMELCNFSLQQLFASDTASSEEVAYKTNLDSPSKATPVASGEKSMIFSPKLEMSLPQKHERDNSIEMSLPQKRERDNSIGTCDMKENINIDKKEEVGSMMSKTKFAKRQPLQDLQQN